MGDRDVVRRVVRFLLRGLALLLVAGAGHARRAAPAEEGAASTASPAGLIATTVGGAVRLVDPRTGTSRVLLEGVPLERPLVWRPGGRELLVWRHDAGVWELWSVPVDGSEPACLAPAPWGGSRSGVWSPDGTRLVFWRTEPEGLAVLRPGGEATTIASDVFRDTPPVWRADGRAVAFERALPTEDDRLRFSCWQATEDADGAWALEHVGSGRPLAYARDGAALLVEGLRADRTGCVVEVDLATGTRRCLTPEGVDDGGAHLTHAGGRIVTVRRGREEAEPWKVISHDLGGGDVREHGVLSDRRAEVVSDPSGRWLAWREKGEPGTTLVVVPVAGGEVRRVPAEVGELLAWQR